MCTLILAWRVFDDAPVLVAANRDEAANRSSSPPREWERAGRRFVAPRDEVAGGTWIGYNPSGLFVGVSNRWTDRELTADRSRGLLVTDALGCERATDAASTVAEAVETVDYDAFNLLLADADTAILVEWDGELGTTRIETGVHVLTNAGFDDEFGSAGTRSEAARDQAETAERILATMEPRPAESGDAWLDRAATLLGDHEVGVCVHGDGYGTRSASLIALRTDGGPDYRYADGAPCTTPFERVEGQS